MTHSPAFRALRAVPSGDALPRYELLLVDEGRDTMVGPLREYAARSALARLGFAAVDIDAWIDRAPGITR